MLFIYYIYYIGNTYSKKNFSYFCTQNITSILFP